MTALLAKRLSAIALATLAPLAQANLVTNGGFETTDFSGWTPTLASGHTFLAVTPLSPHTGTWAATFAAILSSLDRISQTLATTAGTSYDISFWLRVTGDTANNAFEFDWDGGAVELSLVNAPSGNYTQYTFSRVASSNSTVISFGGRNAPAYSVLDDVVVVQSSLTVPEPASLALVGLAVLGATAALRRRRA